MTDITVTRIGRNIGAQIDGADLTRPLDDGAVTTIRRALLRHRVVFFRTGEPLAPKHQLAFMAHFGELSTEGLHAGQNPERPELVVVDSELAEGEYATPAVRTTPRRTGWHSDLSYLAVPHAAATLSAQDIPDGGGDTEWTDLVAAYAALSDPVRSLFDRLVVTHDPAITIPKTDDPDHQARVAAAPPVTHPLVRIHPETGERVLFWSPVSTVKIDGVTPDENLALTQFLNGHVGQPEHSVRWHWQPGDVAFYDNRSSDHRVIQDFGVGRRRLHRVSLRGTRPYGLPEAGYEPVPLDNERDLVSTGRTTRD